MSKNPNFIYFPLRFDEDGSIVNYTNAIDNFFEMGMLDYKTVNNVTLILLPDPYADKTGDLMIAESKLDYFRFRFSFKINDITCNFETRQPRGFAAKIFQEFDKPKPSPEVQYYIRSIMFELYREYINKTMNDWLN